MDKKAIIDLLNIIDDIAREHCKYEMGLPLYDEDAKKKMINAVNIAIHQNKKSNAK